MLDIVMMVVNLLLEKFNLTKERIKSLTPTEKSRLVAYVLVPAVILGLSTWAVYKGWLGIELERPFAVSKLKTVVTGGSVASRGGVVVIAEPLQSDPQIPIAHNNAEIWSSLTEDDVQSNNPNAVLNNAELKLTTPFYGVSEPVAIVVEGELGEKIKFPGRTESVEDWRLSSRRNVSLAFWPLAACFLAYGIAFARVVPVVDRDKNNATKVRTKPNKD